MERNVTVKKWYVVSGTAGDTVTSPDGSKIFCTVPEGGQGIFYATAPKVVTSDDSVEVVETNFNSAPVKQKLLGLLGGGVSTLPSGYLQAEFLHCNNGKYIWTDLLMKNDRGIEVVYEYTSNSGVSLPMYACKSGGGLYCRVSHPDQNTGLWWDKAYAVKCIKSGKVKGTVNFKNDRKITNGDYSANITYTPTAAEEEIDVPVRIAQSYIGLLYSFRFSEGSDVVADLTPALDPQGSVCMFDRVKKKTYFFTASSGNQSQPVIGMTMKQARKLGKLSAGGGTLNVSLPSNYLEDEGVTKAIAAANAKGWNIKVASTFEADGASATFALRRIWVRKTQDEQGNYIDADGVRWQVESCVAMYNADGSEPDAHGYEPFRSVEAACEYWGLTEWVDPEQEELLTNTENE